jgi:hypothetical protein
MAKKEAYALILRQIPERSWQDYLLKESGLPGPRGNLELVQAAAEEGRLEQFLAWLDYTPEKTPADTPLEFLPVCAAVGLGRLLAEGRGEHMARLRELASDPRWRVREGVAMALQRLGERDMPRLIAVGGDWAEGNPTEMRAAAAGLCEPALLKNPEHTRQVLKILDRITQRITENPERKNEGFKALRKGMAYCWSVAIAAHPEAGKPLLEKWAACPDADVRWIVRENLKKDRLARMDAGWVERMQSGM